MMSQMHVFHLQKYKNGTSAAFTQVVVMTSMLVKV